MRIRLLIPMTCIGLHALLALMHLALLGVWARREEQSDVVLPGEASSIQTRVTLASQVFIIVCATACHPSCILH